MTNILIKCRIKLIMTAIIFFSAINYILSKNNFDILDKLDNLIKFKISNIILIIIGICIIYLGIDRDTWLPFLGYNVLPPSLVPETKNVGDMSIKIQVKPNTKVAYWSALPSKDSKITVDKAYGNYSNAGVTKSDKNGFATLTFNKGTGYFVPGNKYIKSHVHFRELNEEWSMMGAIQTKFL